MPLSFFNSNLDNDLVNNESLAFLGFCKLDNDTSNTSIFQFIRTLIDILILQGPKEFIETIFLVVAWDFIGEKSYLEWADELIRGFEIHVLTGVIVLEERRGWMLLYLAVEVLFMIYANYIYWNKLKF
jgi:hypothetical protein